MGFIVFWQLLFLRMSQSRPISLELS